MAYALWALVVVFFGIIVEHGAKAAAAPSIIDVDWPQHVIHQHVKRADNAEDANVCTSAQCTNFAKSIRANLATNYNAIDPCEDFSTYACGGWREKHDYRVDQACKPSLVVLPHVSRH